MASEHEKREEYERIIREERRKRGFPEDDDRETPGEPGKPAEPPEPDDAAKDATLECPCDSIGCL